MSQDVNYKKTIQLPDTDFSQRANLTEMEPRIQEKWEDIDLYQSMRERRDGDPKYVLHDGPPYANGDVHIGTGLNKILKDVVVRFRNMDGYDTPFVPGWDCHGLPIEWNVLQELGDEAEQLSSSEIREKCADSAKKWLKVQRKQFKKLGCAGDWENPYVTMNPEYEASVLEVFRDLVEAGHIYRKNKTIHWCMNCETALAAAELEYEEKDSPSVFTKFRSDELAGQFNQVEDTDVPTFFVIWTTTPWTLPANMATAVNSSYEYALVRTTDPNSGETVQLVFAADLVDRMSEMLNLTDPEVIDTINGAELEGLTYEHPFLDRTGEVVIADYVSLEEGTGCVHIAPGHGEEDYYTGLEYDIDPVCPVDESGTFTAEAGPYEGLNVYDANEHIIEDLGDDHTLLNNVSITHEYPHCWRCGTPVIFRATRQWFLDIEHDGIRDRAIQETENVEWVPDWGETRMRSMLEERPDWCISRQRDWGVPIPVLYCDDCDHPLLEQDVIEQTMEVFREHGAGAWFSEDASTFIPESASCDACGHDEFKQETDIFDVWFESGSSHCAVVEHHPDLEFPADMYLEGTDQHRGWFQVSLIPSLIRNDRSPFRECVTHGFVVDESGSKISKSDMSGLSMNADELADDFGSDLLRLWITSVDFTDDIPVSRDILQEKSDPYMKIRRTLRYLHGNMHDFDPDQHRVDHDELEEIDQWVRHELYQLLENVYDHYENYRFHRVIREIHNFCTIQMSNFFLDVSKDRFYCSPKTSNRRRSAQTVADDVLTVITKMLTPILPHTAEELWEHLPGTNQDSPQLTDWPDPGTEWEDDDLGWNWKRMLDVREAVYSEIERLREENEINESTEAGVVLHVTNDQLRERLESFEPKLTEYFLVSEFTIKNEPVSDDMTTFDELSGIGAKVQPTDHKKCDRCWNHRPSVGDDAEFDDLCQRCASIVHNYVESRAS